MPAFISKQVTEARRFFLNLNPDHHSELEVVCGGVERMRPEYVVDRNDFPYFGIELVAEGEGLLKLHGNKHTLSPGVVFAYGPGVAHEIQNHSEIGMRKYYLDFVGTRAAELLTNAGLMEDSQFKAVSVRAVHELAELFEMFLRDSKDSGPLVPSICETLVQLLTLKIAQLLLPEGNSVPRSYSTFERVRRHIDQRYLQLHTIQEVAEECDVSPVYLSRLFGRFADCGAYQYLLRRKMNYAAGLIMNEGLLVREVAQRLGMTDAFQFSRAFKRVFGVPPSELGNQRESGQPVPPD